MRTDPYYDDVEALVKLSKRAKMMSDDEIRQGIKKMRAIAAPVGPMHAYWDVISDAECLLAGKPTLCSRDVIEKFISDLDTKSWTE